MVRGSAGITMASPRLHHPTIPAPGGVGYQFLCIVELAQAVRKTSAGPGAGAWCCLDEGLATAGGVGWTTAGG